MIKKIMDRMPTIKAVMTSFPHCIELSDPLSNAEKMMTEHGIRYLPVVDDGRLVGVLSDAELKRRRPGATLRTTRVRDARVAEAHIVELSVPLDRVVFEMAEHHLEAVLIVKHGKLAGIFTISDACQCFGDFLGSIFPQKGGDDAA